MIVSFVFPSSPRFGGGLAALYEYANGLGRRGHEVHLIHGPKTLDRIRRVADLDWFEFEPAIVHHIVDALDDPSLPAADVVFSGRVPKRLGLPAELIQGYRLLSASIERPAYRAQCPKFCVARWLTDIGVAWGAPRKQMLHVPLGIDHQRFRLRAPLDDRPMDVAMLYTDHPVKGGEDGLTALREVQRRRPGLRVVLFGQEEHVGDLPDWAEFRAGLDHEGLATEIYSKARVFVQPSWLEGFGLTSVEAMASGCALISTDNGGSRDYAFDGETAIVVPSRNSSMLADAIDGLLGDEDRRVRLATAGARYVRRFDWDLAAEQMEAHLYRYLADPAAFQEPPADAPMFLQEPW